VDAGSYLVSLLLLRSLRAPDSAQPRPEPEGTSLVHEAISGVREIRRHPLLRGLGGFLAAWSVLSGAITALTVPFLLRTIAVPTSLYGLLYAVTGGAGLIGSVVGGALIRRRIGVARIAFVGFVIGAAATVLLPAAYGSTAVATTVAMLGLALPAIGGAIANIGLTGVLTEDVPGHVLGRVIAALKTAAMTATIAGALGGGFLGDAIGVRAALWLLAGAALLSPLLLSPAIRVTRERPVPVSQGASA
jgi:MFS family permease